MIESNFGSFQVRHSFKHWSPSEISNELERDEAGERHPSAAVGIKEAVFNTQMLQGGGVHFRRPNAARLHLETLQRGASREINGVVALDTRELQTREELRGRRGHNTYVYDYVCAWYRGVGDQ